jgi:hypothetical protein
MKTDLCVLTDDLMMKSFYIQSIIFMTKFMYDWCCNVMYFLKVFFI